MADHDQLESLTLAEKAALTSGATAWTTKGIDRAGVPSIVLADGPHGVRRPRHDADPLDLAGSIPATCFPPAVALGSSWDPDLARRIGTALGIEARAPASACCSDRGSTSNDHRSAAATSNTCQRIR